MTCLPGEEHRDRPPDRFVEHLAMWEATTDGNPETTRAEPVTDQRYDAGCS
ncbi:hypothetical protein [Streptomyces lannensis]|uniref:Uncharacterized protein n=1 Tax=Streptomyces lannensis TaxID=766498 RepID=A0ABP7LRR7_9ACTN